MCKFTTLITLKIGYVYLRIDQSYTLSSCIFCKPNTLFVHSCGSRVRGEVFSIVVDPPGLVEESGSECQLKKVVKALPSTVSGLFTCFINLLLQACECWAIDMCH